MGGPVVSGFGILMRMPDVAFEFEALLYAWRISPPGGEAMAAVRAFLDARAHSIVEHLADELLMDALAAWQREGELLFAQRRWPEAQQHYADLATMLAPHAPILAAWCLGAAAECRLEDGDLVSGIADLAEVLETFEVLEYQAGIVAIEQVISDAVGRLESTGDPGLN